MSKFNQNKPTSRAMSGVGGTTTTYEGGPGFVRDPKGELFFLGVANFVGENTFYEKAQNRDERFRGLVQKLAVEDPEWTAGFLTWLRSEGNMRSAPIVGAAEFVHARLEAKAAGGNRQLVKAVLQRPDEPGELLSYWLGRFGKPIPTAIKRGINDAIARNALYNQKSLLKYDTESRKMRFGDVIEICHPDPVGPMQSALFRYAIERRHKRNNPMDDSLTIIGENIALNALSVPERKAMWKTWLEIDGFNDASAHLRAAGMTWESLSGWLQGPMDKDAWQAIIPSMGYMALLRNLRNFDEAGISIDAIDDVVGRLTAPGLVRTSRQLPFRFFSAYKAVNSVTWQNALEKALTLSLANIPVLGGKTLVLVDTSSSMTCQVSEKSTMTPVEIGALFGIALAKAGEDVELRGFAGQSWGYGSTRTNTFVHDVPKGASILKTVEKFCGRIGEVGHGTLIFESIRESYKGHDRVVLITDMQTFPSSGNIQLDSLVPQNVPVYGFNLAGYKASIMSGQPNRYEMGGLTDHTFKIIPNLEKGAHQKWPWLE